MKISRVRHVVITCIIFLIIIALIITVYNNRLEAIAKNTEEYVNRVIATEDITPGTMITEDKVKLVQIQDVVKTDGLVYRLNQMDQERETVDKTNEYKNMLLSGKINPSASSDDRWAIGKTAVNKIHKGELIVVDDLRLPEDMTSSNERIYNISFDSSTTGGYNVRVGDKVDICVLYNDNEKTIKEYQDLEKNKVIDIVLAKKEVADIRDEAGNSQLDNAAVVPGYICFKLSYDEINKIELAKRQGKVFVGITETYIDDAHEETFMEGITLPTFENATAQP